MRAIIKLISAIVRRNGLNIKQVVVVVSAWLKSLVMLIELTYRVNIVVQQAWERLLRS